MDWTINLSDALAMVSKEDLQQIALMYNKDEEVGKVLACYSKGNGHVFNLGHGIHPKIDPENVGASINAVHDFSAKYHQ